jgi:hypothetical protein
MYEPTTLLALAVGTAAAGAGLSAFGQLQAGKAEQDAAEFNAKIQEDDAVAAERKAKYDEEIHRERVKQFISQQRAAIGKSGVQIEGSPLLATIDAAEKGEMDALAIRHGGQVSANRFRSQAQLSRLQGQQARKASKIKAGSTLLTGASRAFGMAA